MCAPLPPTEHASSTWQSSHGQSKRSNDSIFLSYWYPALCSPTSLSRNQTKSLMIRTETTDNHVSYSSSASDFITELLEKKILSLCFNGRNILKIERK
jgi:hypothetical protein